MERGRTRGWAERQGRKGTEKNMRAVDSSFLRDISWCYSTFFFEGRDLERGEKFGGREILEKRTTPRKERSGGRGGGYPCPPLFFRLLVMIPGRRGWQIPLPYALDKCFHLSGRASLCITFNSGQVKIEVGQVIWKCICRPPPPFVKAK